MFSNPFPSRNCFRDLFIRRSLGRRGSSLHSIPIGPWCWLGNQSGAGDFDPSRSEGESVFLRKPFLLH